MTLLVVNTHLFYTSHTEDHGLAIRKEQFKKIMKRIVSMYNNDTVVVFMGDLNFRMNYQGYDDNDNYWKSYQQFIQQQSKKLTRQHDELYTFLKQQEKSISTNNSSYKDIIQGLLNDIPKELPLTCKRCSQQQDNELEKQFWEKFQIRTDKKKGVAPLPSKERKPSNCDKILIHKNYYNVEPSPIKTFKVKNTDHCGVYRILSL